VDEKDIPFPDDPGGQATRGNQVTEQRDPSRPGAAAIRCHVTDPPALRTPAKAVGTPAKAVRTPAKAVHERPGHAFDPPWVVKRIARGHHDAFRPAPSAVPASRLAREPDARPASSRRPPAEHQRAAEQRDDVDDAKYRKQRPMNGVI
jgi:hypothetical protein